MSAPHSSVPRTSELFLKLSTITDILAENQSSRLLCPNDPFIPEVPKLQVNVFSPTEIQVGKDYHKQQHKSATAAASQLWVTFWGWGNHLSLKQPVPFLTIPYHLNLMLFDLLKKINERMPKLQVATTAPPQEHAVRLGESWHPKIQRERENLISQWKANQHIWSHRMPDSRHALCCSSPIPYDSASQWQNSKTTPTAPILPAVLPTPHNCHVEKQESLNLTCEPSAGWSTGIFPWSYYSKLQEAPEAWRTFSLVRNHPVLSHCCCVFTAHSLTSLYRTDPRTKEEE